MHNAAFVSPRRASCEKWSLYERLIVEVDGYAFHSTRAAFERDRARDAELQARGYRVIRITWRQIETSTHAVVARLAAALAVAVAVAGLAVAAPAASVRAAGSAATVAVQAVAAVGRRAEAPAALYLPVAAIPRADTDGEGQEQEQDGRHGRPPSRDGALALMLPIVRISGGTGKLFPIPRIGEYRTP